MTATDIRESLPSGLSTFYGDSLAVGEGLDSILRLLNEIAAQLAELNQSIQSAVEKS